MLKSKKGDLILSLILAIALWMYVVGEMNPTTKKVYRDIPVTLTNEQTLADSGLGVISTSDETMTVTISGKRSVVSDVKSSDIVATVDLSDAAEGDNQLKINIKVPDNVEVKDQSLNKITVSVGKRSSQLKKVKVTYKGDVSKNKEPTATKIDPSSVTVSGASELVNKVAYVKAEVSTDSVKEDSSSTSSDLVAVDKNGDEVSNIDLSKSTAKITSIMYTTKTVDLKVPITNNNSDYDRTTDVPETIKIKGQADAIADVTSITAKTVNISNITEDTSVAIKPVLPSGIELADGYEDLKVKVTVKETSSTKSFTFDTGDITLDNVGSGLTSAIGTDSVKVTVTGTAAQLKKITKSDISLSMDCDGLKAGKHTVDLKASCSESYSKIDVSPSSLTVTLSGE